MRHAQIIVLSNKFACTYMPVCLFVGLFLTPDQTKIDRGLKFEDYLKMFFLSFF